MATLLLLLFLLPIHCSISTVGFTLDRLGIEGRLSTDAVDVENASVDFGGFTRAEPVAVLHPASAEDIVGLVRSAYESARGFGVSARGHGHSINGQAQADGGVVIEMSRMSRRLTVVGSSAQGLHADVWGGELWIDVLRSTLEYGLAPRSWTDYLYLSVGGTLSNGGISGQAFNHGPQISNVFQLDVVTAAGSLDLLRVYSSLSEVDRGWIYYGTQHHSKQLAMHSGGAACGDVADFEWFTRSHLVDGKGELVTCSREDNRELFYGVLGGLGQFGIITRARIALEPAPQRVRWIRVLYSKFSAFTKDQEYLISLHGKPASQRFDYVEGFVIVDDGLINNWRSSFSSARNPVKISSLGADGGVLYSLEMTKNYGESTAHLVDQEVEALMKKLHFIPSSVFTTDRPYVDFLDRVHKGELKLRSKGLWNVPHPWLNLFVPRSQIADFDAGVFKGILGNKSSGPILIYPMNKNKWDSKSSVVTPDEDVFYLVALLRSALDTGEETQTLEHLTHQNQQILSFCKEAGIKVKQYLPHYTTQEEWKDHFGDKWSIFLRRKTEFDPKCILAPGQRIFKRSSPPYSSSS